MVNGDRMAEIWYQTLGTLWEDWLQGPSRDPTTQVLEEALCRFECQRESDEAHVSRSSLWKHMAVSQTYETNLGPQNCWVGTPFLTTHLMRCLMLGWWCFWSPSWITLGDSSPFEHPVDQSRSLWPLDALCASTHPRWNSEWFLSVASSDCGSSHATPKNKSLSAWSEIVQGKKSSIRAGMGSGFFF